MNVRSTARRFRAGWFFGLVASTMLLSTGCSFESAASGLECNAEGASRPGEVCRDGYWRIVADADLPSDSDIVADADLDAPDHQDVPGAHDAASDAASDATSDAVDDADGCLAPRVEALCRASGTCSDSVVVTDDCTGEERTVDCTPFFDFDADPLHCGGCDSACPDGGPNTAPACVSGECQVDCSPGFVDANDDATDGCESACTETNGGAEMCDGVDNDCDGVIDGPSASDAEVYFRDADADGFGDPDDTLRACGQPQGYVANDADCADDDAATNPDAEEICDGQVDDDCNQSVDEQCPCTNGQTRLCGTNQGTCEEGTQTCTGGQWTDACSGSVEPAGEMCDGLDNNCDGDVDEAFSDKGSACSVGVGECENAGTLVCAADGSGLECDATAHSPAPEACDGLDNNCDGDVDETFTDKGTSCTVGVGSCAANGTFVCAQDGAGTECDAVAGTPAASETCGDGIDDDCNGQVDDGCHCDYGNNSQGVCAQGVVGSDGRCGQPAAYQTQETTCDGLDNDCDGFVDEWMTERRYPDADGDGFGDASAGRTRVCPGTPGWVWNNGDCDDGNPWTNPNAAEICDGKDNNCNGTEVDDGGNSSSTWCGRYVSGNNIYCGGPASGVSHLCCEVANDGDLGCDFETVCDNGVDEDADGDLDCGDADCDGLSCASGKTCQAGSCQPI